MSEEKDSLTVCCEHLSARSKDIADRDEIIADLLEALQNLVSETTDGLGYEYNDGEFEAIDKARAAIAKATQ